MSAITSQETLRHPQPTTTLSSRKQLWTGRILGGLVSAFLLFDGGAKLFKAAPVVAAMTRLGYPETTVAGVGALLLACTAMYLFPRTNVLGAVLLSAYLGGTVATNLRVRGPVFAITFPVLCGVLVWAGLALRNGRVRSMFL